MPDTDESLVEEQVISKPGEYPDFRFYLADRPIVVTKSWEREKAGRAGYPIISGIGSSTLEDAQGHIFEKEALLRIKETAVPGTEDARVWNGHDWTTREYVGQIDQPFEITRGARDASGTFVASASGDVWALKVSNWVDTDFPHNQDTMLYLEKAKTDKALKLGYSVGVIYEDVRRIVDRSRGVVAGLRVKSARHKELSLTGMPSNPASWLDRSLGPLVTKGIIPPTERHMGKAIYAIRNFDGFDPATQLLLLRINTTLQQKCGLVLVPDPTAKRIW